MEPNTTKPGTQSTIEDLPGEKKGTKKVLLELGAQITQKFTPINNFNLHLCGFLFYSHNHTRSMEMNYFSSSLNEDFSQSVIFDGDGPEARMIGVEYVISDKLFDTLTQEEQKLWHSHAYAVKSGALIAPSMPDISERSLMKNLVKTYGKTWIFWQVDRGDTLPVDIPQLMMAATHSGQARMDLVEKRDARLGTNTKETIENLKDIPFPKVNPNADGWKNGPIQLTLHCESPKNEEMK